MAVFALFVLLAFFTMFSVLRAISDNFPGLLFCLVFLGYTLCLWKGWSASLQGAAVPLTPPPQPSQEYNAVARQAVSLEPVIPVAGYSRLHVPRISTPAPGAPWSPKPRRRRRLSRSPGGLLRKALDVSPRDVDRKDVETVPSDVAVKKSVLLGYTEEEGRGAGEIPDVCSTGAAGGDDGEDASTSGCFLPASGPVDYAAVDVGEAAPEPMAIDHQEVDVEALCALFARWKVWDLRVSKPEEDVIFSMDVDSTTTTVASKIEGRDAAHDSRPQCMVPESTEVDMMIDEDQRLAWLMMDLNISEHADDEMMDISISNDADDAMMDFSISSDGDNEMMDFSIADIANGCEQLAWQMMGLSIGDNIDIEVVDASALANSTAKVDVSMQPCVSIPPAPMPSTHNPSNTASPLVVPLQIAPLPTVQVPPTIPLQAVTSAKPRQCGPVPANFSMAWALVKGCKSWLCRAKKSMEVKQTTDRALPTSQSTVKDKALAAVDASKKSSISSRNALENVPNKSSRGIAPSVLARLNRRYDFG